MEVHHHPDLHHKKKKFKEYFLEFLMIFLAVTMGFFAENIREHFAENRQEHEYVQSMINDLKTDTANIAWYTKVNKENQLAYCDSLIEQLDKEKWDDTTKAAIYIYKGYQGSTYIYFFPKQTLIQLKNGGGAKLIKNRAALDSIMNYDADISMAEDQAKSYVDFTTNIFDIAGKIFYAKKINNAPGRDSVNNYERIAWYVKNGKVKDLIIDNDQKDLNEFISKIKARKSIIETYLEILSGVSDDATYLIKFLKKEYNLENE